MNKLRSRKKQKPPENPPPNTGAGEHSDCTEEPTESFSNIPDPTEERTSHLEARTFESIQRNDNNKKNKKRVQKVYGIHRYHQKKNILITGILEGEEKGKGQKYIQTNNGKKLPKPWIWIYRPMQPKGLQVV